MIFALTLQQFYEISAKFEAKMEKNSPQTAD